MLSLFRTLVICFSVFSFAAAQSTAASTAGGNGYSGYNLTLSDDPESAVYDTDNTPSDAANLPAPDVYLNASVFIGEISILVANLTAKINLDAQVLSLLKFNAGVDLHIDKVSLLIQNVTAKVLLEARLENLVLMIDDILASLDLNPLLATLGQNVNKIGDAVGGLLDDTTSGLTQKRSVQTPFDYELAHNILYSVNNYAGHTHTNRVLSQTGDLVDQKLDDMGHVLTETVVGNYLQEMTFKGDNQTVTHQGQEVQQLEYVYEPFRGLTLVSFVFVNGEGNVVATQVMTEAFAGGSSTIGDN